jgi:hypothetical protein
MPPKLTPAQLRRRTFAKGIAEGKTITAAYKVVNPEASNEVAQAAGSRLLGHVMTQEEIIKHLAQVTPENITARINDIAVSAPLPETKLKALALLGNTRKASIFKDNTPSITNNTLNVFDLDELRRRLADTSYSNGSITDQTL